MAHRDPSKVEHARELESRYPYRPDSSSGIATALKTGKTELLPTIPDDLLQEVARDAEHLKLLREAGMVSAMLVPLRLRERIIGVISFVSAESGRRYAQGDLLEAEALAEHAALAIENARLYRLAQQEIEERRQTEKALLQSEHRLRALFEGAQDTFLLADDFGHYVDANPAAALLTGYSREELLRMGLWDLFPIGDRATVQALWREFIASGKQAGEIVLRRKDGTLVETEYRAVANFVPRLHMSFLRDITDRKRIEKDLASALESREKILARITDSFIALDPDFRYRYVNRAAEKLMGKASEELLGKTVWEVFPETRGNRADREFHRAMEERVSVQFEESYPALGRWYEHRAFPSPEGLTVLVTDITDRKRTEVALRESEERFRHLIEGVKEYALFLLDAEGKVISWNSGAERLEGYAAAEVIGHPHSLFYTSEDQESGKPRRLLEQAAREGHVKEEGWRVARGSRRFWAEEIVTSLYEHDGRLRGFVTLTRDLSERRSNEEAIVRLNQGLERRVEERTTQVQEAAREMESFAYTIAHDLRAPLRTIAGFSELLVEEYRDSLSGGSGRIYLEQIKLGAQRMDTLISDLLEYSRVSHVEIQPEPVDLEGVVWEALAALSGMVEEKQATVFVRSPLPQVLACRPLMALVIPHLLSNALKFVDKATRPQIRLTAEDRSGRVRVWVEDNGIGIPPAHRDRIFGVFERLNRMEEYPGTGMGLALVRRAVIRMGGNVGVESQERAGSRFWIELPGAGPQA